jgi:uncharacterized RDD family membrane protein YckC
MEIPPDSTASHRPPSSASADVIIRFIAKLIDGVVLAILVSLVAVALSPLRPVPMRPPGTSFMHGTGFMSRFEIAPVGLYAVALSVISALITLGYLSVLESMRGQTIGKMFFRLKVVGPSGGRPTIGEAVKRNSWVLVSIIPWFGGLVQLILAAAIGYSIYDSVTNDGWHDNLAGGTRVIRAESS